MYNENVGNFRVNTNWIHNNTIDSFAVRNYLKYIIQVHMEKVMSFERIIAMIYSIFVDTANAN